MKEKLPIKLTTLCFVFNPTQTELLLIEKKRGMGAGKWNAPGGKLLPGETAMACAARECEEETGLRPLDLEARGRLEFYFEKDSTGQASNSWDNICEVFVANSFTGTLLEHSEESRNFWWPVNSLPFDKFWEDDKYWLPELLAGKSVFRKFYFNNKNELLRSELSL